MADLTTTEKYALAQILVCGKIDENEFQEANNYSGVRQQKIINGLVDKGLLCYTLYNGGKLKYEEQ